MAKVHSTLPPTYELIDGNNEEIRGIFYNEDLTRAASPGGDTDVVQESEPTVPQSSPADETQPEHEQPLEEEEG